MRSRDIHCLDGRRVHVCEREITTQDTCTHTHRRAKHANPFGPHVSSQRSILIEVFVSVCTQHSHKCRADALTLVSSARTNKCHRHFCVRPGHCLFIIYSAISVAETQTASVPYHSREMHRMLINHSFGGRCASVTASAIIIIIIIGALTTVHVRIVVSACAVPWTPVCVSPPCICVLHTYATR